MVELVLALGIVSAGDEASNLDPVILVQLLRSDALAAAVFLDGPLQKVCLIIGPIFLGIIGFFALEFG